MTDSTVDRAEVLDRLLAGDRTSDALEMLARMRPADAADLLESLDDDGLAKVAEIWEPNVAAEALHELEPERQAALAERLPPERLAHLLDAMSPDDAASFLQEVEPDRRARILGRMERDEAAEVAELLDFPEDSAGRLMSPDFVAVAETMTVQQVIDRLRQVPDDVELIYYVYVLGGSEQLKGVAALRSLITADPSTPVGEIMQTDIVSVKPTDDRETCAGVIRRYSLIAVPVADDFGRMLGIVTVDDVLEAMEEEAEEDVLRFAGALEEDPARPAAWPAVRRRLPWLALGTAVELAIAYLLLRPLPIDLLVVIVAYIPLLVFVAGNVAVQAAARVLVRLEGGRTEAWSPWGQARNEMQAGLVLAVLAALVSAPLLVLLGRQWEFALLVSGALAVAVVLGAGLGAVLPVVLHRLRMDPAIASGPLLGSAMDILSLSVYLSLASMLSKVIT